jgi:RNA polymerase sigma factor (sigma-70 family)
MKTLDELALEYKKTKNKNLLNNLFILLQPMLKKKSEYIFYHKQFKCGNSSVRLCNTKKVELDDIIQELNLEVLRIIDNYDVSRPFKNYFFSTLWDWRPDFIRTGNFGKEINMVISENILATDENTNFLDNMADPNSVQATDDTPIFQKFTDLTDQEKKVMNLLMKNNKINQSQIAKIIGVTQQRVGQIINKLKNKYNPDL